MSKTKKLKTKWFMTITGDNIVILDAIRHTHFREQYLDSRHILDNDYPDQISATIPISGIDDLFALVTALDPLKSILVNFYCDAEARGVQIRADLTASERDYSHVEFTDALLDKELNDKLKRIRAILDE